ncbi:MAG: hypothetical protein L6R42_008402 [Xanthoria sp. 1 TBL-2021]|nr:MAG: hypothetical protein L6R42_008402 [Xanthoria sp. 1 TBL-2021]
MASYLQDLSTVQEVYGAIHKETEISEVGVDVDEYIDFIQTQLAEAKRYHPWMHDVDEEDLHDWAMKYEAQKMNSNRIASLDRIRLENYSKQKMTKTYVVSPALGWVIMQDLGGVWQKAGHVMVIDMDDRNVRHRQPWLVLASEWPADGQDLPDGGFSFYAPETVRRDDRNQAGVFPGDNNRTTICRIVPQGREEKPGEIILFQLGENFNFALERKGGHRDWRRTDRGPELARSMDWYFDPETKEQVCYNKQGREWLRYNQASKEYYFSDVDVRALEGETGFYGEVSGLPVAEIPHHQWKAYEDHEQELRDLGYEPPLPGQARSLVRTVGTWPGF